MAVDRAPVVDQKLVEVIGRLKAAVLPRDLDLPVREGTRLTGRRALDLVDAQFGSRHLDLAARELRARGEGFYTIGSSGHEGNAAVAAVLRVSDPAFLHYRSGAFFLLRARDAGESSPLLDVLLGVAASKDDPISGGRHKVFGSLSLSIPPQTSTIASHLPKAVGAAFALERLWSLGLGSPLPEDAIVVCSFGDASVNHSTAVGALNTAAWTAYQNLPLPILFVCEDNGIGISVSTPEGWVAAMHAQNPAIRYFFGDGLDLCHAFDAATDAVCYVRERRRPAFLHLKTVRLLGHAGSDVEQSYRSQAEIEASEARDPLLASARILVESGVATPDFLVSLYEEVRGRVGGLAREAAKRPRLSSRAEVMAPLSPDRPDEVEHEVLRQAPADTRASFWEGRLPECERPAHLGEQLNRALGDLLVKYPECLVFGEDVARKGGVYHVTHDLFRRAGAGRVFNTLLDEQSILGLAQGAGQAGFLPVCEIQYLAYLHNALDQIRGEAASLQFFSNGQFQNPMVVRVAGYAYQKGFGGHFHNDNAVAALRDIPGILVASPSRGDDAVAILRTLAAAARVQGAVCLFLEPIALYMTRDLYEPKDAGWETRYEPRGPHVSVGSARTYGEGRDLLVVSFANGLWMSLRVAKRLKEKHGIDARVMDLRWLLPLPVKDLLKEAGEVSRVLVVDETRASGGVSEGVFAALLDHGYEGKLARVAAADSFIPLGPNANWVLVQEEEIERRAVELCSGKGRS